ncbi:phage tail assembly chaperone, partial [Streptococcus anginosus]
VITATLAFLRAVLNLSDEQMEILEDLDTERTQEIANYVSGRLMGLSDEQLEEIKKENAENPKE